MLLQLPLIIFRQHCPIYLILDYIYKKKKLQELSLNKLNDSWKLSLNKLNELKMFEMLKLSPMYLECACNMQLLVKQPYWYSEWELDTAVVNVFSVAAAPTLIHWMRARCSYYVLFLQLIQHTMESYKKYYTFSILTPSLVDIICPLTSFRGIGMHLTGKHLYCQI